MIPRPLALAGVLGAAVGVPYAMNEGTEFWPNQQASQQTSFETGYAHAMRPPLRGSLDGPGSEIYRQRAPIEGYRGLPLASLLRWDITKEWVYANWDRKSTGLAEPGLFGIRAPIVTGQQMTDIAGSISYYFDSGGALQKIRLNGTTADTTELVQLASSTWGMQRRTAPSPGDQLYQAAEGKRVRSELSSRPQSVLWSTSPHSSFQVNLELNRPGSRQWISRRIPPPPQPPIAETDPTPETEAQRAEQAGQPIFPSRAVVPDDPRVENPRVATQAVETTTEPPNVQTPAVAKPSNDIAPLDSYRDRFRWPL